MNRKTLVISIFIILSVLLVPLVLVMFCFLLPAQYDLSFYGGMKIKYDRLKNTEGNKIVIIGGSSVAFGVCSDLLESELDMPVVNFGLYANLGTKYMLDVAEDYIEEGDIVIISPEQHYQALSLYFNGEAAWYTADSDFSLLSKVKWDNAGDIAKSFLSYTSGKFGYWRTSKPCPDGVYNVYSFNEYGDISYERAYNEMTAGYDAGTPIYFNEEVISQDFIDYINEYNKVMTKRGATVYFAFSPMNAAALSVEDTDEIADYYSYLNGALDFEIIGNPLTHILDKDWFYDSNFHLNSAGAVYYTRLLAMEIKSELEDYTPVSIALPDMPVKEEEAVESSGISAALSEAAAIFNLSLTSISTSEGVITTGGWQIDGLTEYGLTLSEIKIPDEIAGLPVKAIASGAFAGDTNVVKITFGLNISYVGIDAFDGCSSLTAIYITSTDPNSYNVSSSALEGAENCYFYVPEESYYSGYLIDYFWGAISSRLRSY